MGKKRAEPGTSERPGVAVEERREELGLTQEDLAQKAKSNRTYLSDTERGRRDVRLVNIERLAAGLSMTTSEMSRLVEEPSLAPQERDLCRTSAFVDRFSIQQEEEKVCAHFPDGALGSMSGDARRIDGSPRPDHLHGCRRTGRSVEAGRQ